MKIILKINKKKKKNSPYLPPLLFVIFAFSLFLILNSLHKKEESPVDKNKDTLQPQIADTPPPLKVNKEVIQKGMALSNVLAQYNFSPVEIHNLRKNVKPVYDLAKIKAGHELRIYSSHQGEVISLEYDIDKKNYLLIQEKLGSYSAEIKKIPYDIKIKMIWGIIEDNLISTVTQEGEGSTLALLLAELFAWDVDFYTDLRQGDAFKMIYEKKYLRGKFVEYRNILAAEFTNQGKTFQGFRYTYSDTKKSDYFNLEGNSLRKEFLKSPLPYARITSRYARRRLHPIRKVYRPHYGVDYAARVGTQVQATADGIVTFIGWNGSSGRMIKIRHKNAYETMYLHLRNYARGIRKGARVKGGQVIGYVGSSGESTGPHLDYRIKYRGRYINPLAWRFKPVNPLREEFSKDFRRKAEEGFLCFEAPLLLFFSLRLT